MAWSPLLCRVVRDDGQVSYSLGHPLLDAFLVFCEGRARPNTTRAYAHDLKVFFTFVDKEPTEVTSADVLDFIADQRAAKPGRENVVHFPDASPGLSAATVKRRLAALSALYGYLLARGDTASAPTRCRGGCRPDEHAASSAGRPWCARSDASRGSWSPRRPRPCSRRAARGATGR